ncbi:hypothetical protein StrepF001_45125 [Streptomyces sp. F001]|nr:hypothetical protein StrepF001_45125 [Streptomyces sp. F001]
MYAEAQAALEAVPQLDTEDMWALVSDAADPTDSSERLSQLRQNYLRTRQSLTQAARESWGTDAIA